MGELMDTKDVPTTEDVEQPILPAVPAETEAAAPPTEETGEAAPQTAETEAAPGPTEGTLQPEPVVTMPFGWAKWCSWERLVPAAVVLAVLAAAAAVWLCRKKRAKAVHRTEPGTRTGFGSPEQPPKSPAVRVAVCQGQGARGDQQDSYGWTDRRSDGSDVLAVVADGMGGLSNGSLVSSTLVQLFREGFTQAGENSAPDILLMELTAGANSRICQMLRGAPRSGSTLVSAIVRSGYLFFLNVGDSRIYLYRSGALLQLNRAHIYQEELALRAVNREIPFREVYADRQAHSLTSYFGSGKIMHLDRNENGIKLVKGDRILLCSDGIYGTLTNEQLEQAMNLDPDSAAKNIGEMVEQASIPHQDNFTALLLEYQG